MSNDPRWYVSPSARSFLENALRSHSCVDHCVSKDGLFEIVRKGQLAPIRILLVEIYTIGVSNVMEAKSDFPQIDCIVTNGSWSSWTEAAKKFGLRNKIGVFNTSQFLGALHRKNVIRYNAGNPRGSTK